MTLVTADRVLDTTTTIGVGPIAISGYPPYTYQTFSRVMSVNDTCYYCIASHTNNEWEVGLGTYSSANTLARTTVISSSNSNAVVNLSPGVKDIFIVFPGSVVLANIALIPGAAAAATAAAGSATAAAASVTSASAFAAAAAASLASAQALAGNGPYPIFPSTTAALANGVKSTTGIVAGSGGTNGQFDIAFSGGGGTVQAIGRFTVAGGALTSITIISPGYGYTSAPSMSFAASTGLTGASATAVIGANVPVGGYFYTPSSDPSLVSFYSVTTGPTANLLGAIPSANATFSVSIDLALTARGNTQELANQYVRAPLSKLPGSQTLAYHEDLTGWTATGSVTFNSDGTVTIGAGATLSISIDPSDNVFGTNYVYYWVTEVNPIPGIYNLTFVGYYLGSPTASLYQSQIVGPGQYKFSYRNNNGSGGAYFNTTGTITNTGAYAVTIYPLMATLVNSTVPPCLSWPSAAR